MKKLTFITLLVCFVFAVYAQNEKADKQNTKVLVYIMPDSLELAPTLKRGVKVQDVVVKSRQLSASPAAADL